MRPLVSLNGRKANIALFLSGGGSNAREILKLHKQLGENSPVSPVVLVTDRLKDPGCGAKKIGLEFGIPVVGEDIRELYKVHSSPVTLKTEEGRKLRESWTRALREKLSQFKIDFAVFAGFETLSNITEDYCCLNVHPGDLTYLKDGRRYLVGLHTVPIERAILEGLSELRSSVIIATPCHGVGDDMDAGPLLAISPPVELELSGHSLEELRTIAGARSEKRPAGGYGDLLEEIAKINQDRLKEGGDWVVFPRVVFAVAREQFALDSDSMVYFREDRASDFKLAGHLVFNK